jgi:hypothetical protein
MPICSVVRTTPRLAFSIQRRRPSRCSGVSAATFSGVIARSASTNDGYSFLAAFRLAGLRAGTPGLGLRCRISARRDAFSGGWPEYRPGRPAVLPPPVAVRSAFGFCSVDPRVSETLDWRNIYDPDGPSYRMTTDKQQHQSFTWSSSKLCRCHPRIPVHPEYKFDGPEGQPCRRDTRGLLQRRPIHLVRAVWAHTQRSQRHRRSPSRPLRTTRRNHHRIPQPRR